MYSTKVKGSYIYIYIYIKLRGYKNVKNYYIKREGVKHIM